VAGVLTYGLGPRNPGCPLPFSHCGALVDLMKMHLSMTINEVVARPTRSLTEL
jgi:hypothetical protein